MTLQSTATVPTPNASRYLQQLAKHFGHKVPATFDAAAGEIAFPFGLCHLAAEEGALRLTVDAGDEAALTRLREVIASHLIRFAFREDLAVDWQPARG